MARPGPVGDGLPFNYLTTEQGGSNWNHFYENMDSWVPEFWKAFQGMRDTKPICLLHYTCPSPGPVSRGLHRLLGDN